MFDMVDKRKKREILELIQNKEERIFLSHILDMAMKFEMTEHMAFTYFLNLKELSMVKSALNALEIDYMVFRPNENLERSNILFLPDYLKENVEKICSQNVGCMKIIPSCYKKLFHKDYMGAIYSLGIKHELIGDIVAKENFAYVFYMKSIEEYLKLHLTQVGNQEVKMEEVLLDSEEVKMLSFAQIQKECIIPSMRADALLSEVYHLSRKEAKEKIAKGDLLVNDRMIYFPDFVLKEGDIVSFRRCGKLKVGAKLRETRSNQLVIAIWLYC